MIKAKLKKQSGHLALEHLLLTAGAILALSGIIIGIQHISTYSNNFQEQPVITNNK
ncbi:MAG: hypothetical protein IT292_04330 [Deltaproteobacteria bacterium]|nr:hypothetical protein [Deltaproteobacteria bacterium]